MKKHPLLYQLNTRVYLTELSEKLGRKASLKDIPDEELDHLQEQGFDHLWLLSIWATGARSREISQTNKDWRKDFENTLQDLKDEDIGGSGFAISSYTVSPLIGGQDELLSLRERLKKRNLKLILDFVPNHMGLDHEWLDSNPDHFVQGSEEKLLAQPENYFRRLNSSGKEQVFAHGRDPYFSGWPDTVQLNYANEKTRESMKNELMKIAEFCDGVRCDMAMLVIPQVFERTWGMPSEEFWTETTKTVKAAHPNFTFIAEVYWDMEWDLQERGFDFTYDKRLYDRLRAGQSLETRDHLKADLNYQNRMARFLENHDEPRAATSFDAGKHQAAACITFLSPGMKFFHQGQFEGCRKRISPHLIRGPKEEHNAKINSFYCQLLKIFKAPVLHDGDWGLCQIDRAWTENWTAECFVSFAWRSKQSNDALIVVANYADHPSQCYLRIPISDCKKVQFCDQLSDITYTRSAEEISAKGLYLDLPAWGRHIFEVHQL